MRVRTDRPLIRAAAESTRYVVLDLVAPAAPPRKDRAAVNIAIVIDRSGSMGRRGLELAKAAAIAALRLLRPTDCFSVVVYDDQIDVLVESTPATLAAVRSAEQRIAPIDARGSTDLFGGWLRGCEQIAAHLAGDSIGRCLFLSDGQANVGTTGPAEIGAHVRQLRMRGVSTSTFGIGLGFNAELMQGMADEGGGHFYFVERADHIAEFLASELGEALDTTARDVAVEVETSGLVTVEVVSAFRSEKRGTTVRVALGDLVSNQEVTLLLALRFPTGVDGANVAVPFQVSAADATFVPAAGDVEWKYAGHRENDGQARDRDVDRIVAQLYAQRGRVQAVRLNAEQRYAEAGALLRRIARRISGYAFRDAPLVQIVQELECEAEQFSEAMAVSSRMAYHSSGSAAMRSRESTGRSRRRQG